MSASMLNYDMNQSLRKMYKKMFPTDELGEYINPKATLYGVFIELESGGDIYKYIGTGDSVIRERVFQLLSQKAQIPYGIIYEAWLRTI